MFIALIILAATALAGVAGFFSIFGLAQIYAASAISVIVMGASLEFAKLVAASYLYRYWNKISLWLKSYLIVAVLTLMMITSMGIFGYLTAAYQQDSVPVTEVAQKIASDKTELDRLTTRKVQIDAQIEKIPNNMVSARTKLMKSFDAEYKTLNPNIDRLTKEISELQSKELTVKAKIGPIMYVAEALHQDPSMAIIWFTLLLVCVIDPLAVTLTIAANVAIADRKKKEVNVEPVKIDIEPEDNSWTAPQPVSEPLPDVELTLEPVVEIEPVIDERFESILGKDVSWALNEELSLEPMENKVEIEEEIIQEIRLPKPIDEPEEEPVPEFEETKSEGISRREETIRRIRKEIADETQQTLGSH